MSNIKNNIMMNLFQNNIIKKENSIEFITMNKDYIIELERKDFKLWFTDKSFKYICKFIFKSNLRIPILELSMNENDVYKLLDSFYSYREFGMKDVYIPLSSINSNLYQYIIKIEYSMNSNSLYEDILTIIEMDNINHIQIERIKISFNEEYISEFLNLIYFTFIGDIDNLLSNPNFLL